MGVSPFHRWTLAYEVSDRLSLLSFLKELKKNCELAAGIAFVPPAQRPISGAELAAKADDGARLVVGERIRGDIVDSR
jgi:hypothetical protein